MSRIPFRRRAPRASRALGALALACAAAQSSQIAGTGIGTVIPPTAQESPAAAVAGNASAAPTKAAAAAATTTTKAAAATTAASKAQH